MRRRRLLLLLITVASLWVSASAQTGVERGSSASGLFRALRWRSIGPDRGGRSLASAGSPSRPLEYYFGAVGGGVWKTTDGGTTWRPVTDGQIRSSSVGALAVSESNPDVVYIGMGEAETQRNMLQGDGVYKTADSGKTWTHLGLADSQAIARIRIHPRNPDLVYVAAMGHPFGPNDERGLYRSKDGGRSWQRILFRDNRTGATDLAMARQNPNLLFAALWQTSVAPGGSAVAGGTGSGLFKSADAGDTWTEITRNPGLPKGNVGKIGVAVAGADSNRVYALVDAEDGGVFRSDDGGATWTKMNDEGALRQRPSYFNRIYADPTDKDIVYVHNLPFFKSTDGGRSFRQIQGPHVDHHDLWIAPNDPGRMIDSNDGGATVSINGGETWTSQAYPTAQLYHVATTRDVPYDVCGAQQDASAICVPSSQARWRSASPYVGSGGFSGPIYAPGSGEFGSIAPHPVNPDLFVATGPSVITRYDRRTGLTQARDIQVSPRADRGADRERFATIAPIVFSHHDPNVIYTASQHVWRTADGGMKWDSISPDLSRVGGRAAGGRGGSVVALAPSHHDAGTIWAGTDDGLVQVTRDAGRTWLRVTPPGLPEATRISAIEASPHWPGGAYVAAKRFEYDDRSPYIFKTDDYGKTWTAVVRGIPSSDFVHVVREDPTRARLLYAGTEHGVFVSFDDGAEWQSLSLNLPDTQVPDLVVEAHDLVIATHGRSFYVLDDIEPLRQWTPAVTTSALHLFRPRDAIRRLTQATIDYVLKTPAPSVAIEILDGSGKVVRRYASGGEDPVRTGGSEPGEPRPPRAAGLNRFVWDLRYTSATVFPGMVMWVGSPIGPIAAPGSYQVRVVANGASAVEPFKVVRDPRSTDVTDADVQEQFALALKVRDKISDANNGVILIRRVKAQIQDRIAKAKDAEVTSAGESVSRRLSEVEGELYQVKLRSELDATTYPIMLNNRLANLKLSIETGDGKPTPQAYAAFQQLASEVDAQLRMLDDALAADMGRLNRLLADRKIEPVRPSGS